MRKEMVVIIIVVNCFCVISTGSLFEIYINDGLASPTVPGGNHYILNENDQLSLWLDEKIEWYNIGLWLDMDKFSWDFSQMIYLDGSEFLNRGWYIFFQTTETKQFSGFVFENLQFNNVYNNNETGILTIEGPDFDDHELIASFDVLPIPEPLTCLFFATGFCGITMKNFLV